MNETLMQNQVEELLRQRIGLNPESIGTRSIMRAVRKGIRTGKMNGISNYLQGLQSNPELFESLVESVVVPETSFFRNRASFVFLRQWVAQEWLGTGTGTGKTLRVLSIPCSTGEEPYSIAITLLEQGLALNDFHIDAVDINEQAIAKAKEGIYSPYAFRKQTYGSDEKYFTLSNPSPRNPSPRNPSSRNPSSRHSSSRRLAEATGKQTDERTIRRPVQRYHLSESIRKKVIFMQGNLLTPGLLAHQPPYDVVFCRNLLIYFDQAARDYAMTFFDRMLKPKGLLFLGYAEAGLIDTQKYKPVPYPQTFAYYRREHPITAGHPASKNASSNGHLSASSFADKHTVEQQTLPNITSTPVPLSASPSGPSTADTTQSIDCKPPDLAITQQLANSGNIEQAIQQCDLYLLHCPKDAKAHLLRGELYQAQDELAAAERCFEKALYLDTQLEEALTHLMLLKEAQGAVEETELIRKRIQRIKAPTI